MIYNMYKKNTLGSIIGQIRQEKQLTQNEFAKLIGYKETQGARISEIEIGYNKNHKFISEDFINTIIDRFNIKQEENIDNIWKAFYMNKFSSFGYELDIKVLGKYIDADIADRYINKKIIPNEILFEQLIEKYDLSKDEMEEIYEQATEYIYNTNNLSNIQSLSINVSKEIYKDSGLKSYVEFKKATGVGIERRISNKLKCPSLLETKQLIIITDKLGLDINKYLNMFGIKKIYTYQEAYRFVKYYDLSYLSSTLYTVKKIIAKRNANGLDSVMSLKDCLKFQELIERYDKDNIIKEQIEKDDYGYEEIDRNEKGEIENIHNTMEYKFEEETETIEDEEKYLLTKIEDEEKYLLTKIEDENIEKEIVTKSEEAVIGDRCVSDILNINISGLSQEKVLLLKSFINRLDNLSDKDMKIIETILEVNNEKNYI